MNWVEDIEGNHGPMEEALRGLIEENRYLSTAISHLTTGVIITNPHSPNHSIIFANHGFTLLTGYDFEEVIGRNCRFLQGEKTNPEAVKKLRIAIEKQQSVTVEIWNYRKDGTGFWNEVKINPVFDEERTLIYFIGLQTDITERKKVEQVIEESEQRYKSLFDNNPDAVYAFDLEGKFTSANAACEKVSGYTVEELLQLNFQDLVIPDKLEEKQLRFEMARNGEAQEYEIMIRHKEGHVVELHVSTIPILIQKEIVGLFGIAKDITERKKSERTIVHLAYHDALTLLPNRAFFKEKMTEALNLNEANKEYIAVLFLDIDHFKFINDTLGHIVGDELLKTIAMRLKGCVREGDTISRLGGDEFTILLPQIKDFNAVNTVANRIIEAFKTPVEFNHQLFHLTTSIGIAISPNHGTDVDSLMRNADMAMYSVKENGKNHYRYYDETMNFIMTKRVTMEAELRKAIEHEEFVLFYQPQVKAHTSAITGAEVLIRWIHPTKGVISPADFIPVAEETGLIIPIDEWVLRSACTQFRKWQLEGYMPMKLSVNISSQQLQMKSFVQRVKDIVAETEMDARCLDIEITERTMLNHVETTIATLIELKAMGISISIDDFGTGYSSLSYLRRFPVDVIKIDRSFIQSMEAEGSENEPVVQAIIAMAHSLKLRVIAEGVESKVQERLLHKHQCDEMQGFLYSRPVPSEEFTRYLATGMLKLT